MTPNDTLKIEHDRLNAGLAPDEFCLREGLKFKIHPDSRFPFEFFTWRSVDMTNEMNAFLELSKDKKCLLDIGALHGIFSLAFTVGHPERYSVSIEPSPIATLKLNHNMDINDISCDTIQCAFSDSTGKITMRYDWEHLVAGPQENSTLVCVEKRTGDYLCNWSDFKPDIIKIDVEGHELKVLRGLKETIKQFKPLIFLEIHPGMIALEGESVDSLVNLIKEYGYDSKPISGFEYPGQNTNVILTPCESPS